MNGRLILPLALVLGCAEDDELKDNDVDADAPTYYADARAIVDARCATCHQDGDIGPFPLTTYDEVMAFSGPVLASIENGSMPPWQPSDECNSFQGNIDLTADEKDILIRWLDAGGPEGDPADASESVAADEPFAVDLSLQLPEPYTPVREPDDYRCQLIPWPEEETRYVTGLRVNPDQRSIVHHVIVFMVGPDQVAQYEAYDAAEEGPGYTCYGGPTAGEEGGFGEDLDPAQLFAVLEEVGLTIADLQAGNVSEEQLAALLEAMDVSMPGGFGSLGSWVPGVPASPLPEGTGIRVEPGSMLVVQMHYNTLSSDPVPDQSTIEIATAASVDREATNLPMVDVGWVTNGMFGDPMTIPAGEAEVSHATIAAFDSMLMASARTTLGLPPDAPLVLHSANHHMHELGVQQRSEIRHADGDDTCLLDIPDWDFNWQGAYTFSAPITLQPGDAIWMGCTWDNSAANQPVIDGEVREPADVSWGEGTSDEMCLGAYYVTGE
ncbi:MAG: cytochrome c [Myxococcota bacterium]